MAEVFAATHTAAAGFQQIVCLKLILPGLASDPEFRQLFLREAHLAGRLHHSNLVQVIDCLDSGQHLALVMEFIDGTDLRALLRRLQASRRQLPIELVLYIAGQILCGLHHAHHQEVIHRDISPSNILLSRHGEVKIADFGIAKALTAQLTQSRQLKGKLAYMAPEQAAGQPVDARTDLYSAGLVFYELATGQRFFRAATHTEAMAAVLHARRPRLKGLASPLARLIEALLEPLPANRPFTAREAFGSLSSCPEAGPGSAFALADFLASCEQQTAAICSVEPDTPTKVPTMLAATALLSRNPTVRGPGPAVEEGDPNETTATRYRPHALVNHALSLVPPSRPQPGLGRATRSSRNLLALSLVLFVSLAGWALALHWSGLSAAPLPPPPSTPLALEPASMVLEPSQRPVLPTQPLTRGASEPDGARTPPEAGAGSLPADHDVPEEETEELAPMPSPPEPDTRPLPRHRRRGSKRRSPIPDSSRSSAFSVDPFAGPTR